MAVTKLLGGLVLRLALGLLVAGLVLSGVPATTGFAQGGSDDKLDILRVDAKAAPEIDLRLAVQDATGNPVLGLGAGDFHVTDNGKASPVTSAAPVDVGLQLGVVIDASSSINDAGATGQSRIDETRAALSNLLLDGGWMDVDGRSDWVMLLAQGPKNLEVLTADDRYREGWTNDYQLAYNKAYLFDTSQAKGETPVLEAVSQAIGRMGKLPSSAGQAGNTARSLIVLSDGTSGTSRMQLQDVVTAAQRANVAIYTILLGRSANEASGRSLAQLSSATGGSYVVYDGPASLQSLYQSIADRRHQYRLGYRANAAGHHLLRVEADTAASGAAGSGPYDEVSFNDALEPINVAISAPVAGAVFEKAPTDATPRMPVALDISGDKSRKIAEVTYVLDGTRHAVTQAPFDRIDLPMKDVPDGQHSLHAEVKDEVGLVSQTGDVPVVVRTLEPLLVSFAGLAPGATIRRPSPSPWNPTSPAGPRSQPVRVSWQTADGHPRGVKWVEFLVDGQSYLPSTDTMDLFNWDLSQVTPGSHLLRVRLKDELGLTAESEPMSVYVEAEAASGPNLYAVLALLVALAALGIGIYILSRNRRAVSTAGKNIAGKIRSATQPWHPERLPRRKNFGGAYLIVEEGDSNYLQPIPLASSNIRIGRDESLVNLQLEDGTVSRLHARISREQDGGYRIFDEGSTSGTYVNNQRVGMTGQLLQANDILQMGRVCMRFVRSLDMPGRPQAPANDRPAHPPAPQPTAEPSGSGSGSDDLFDTEPWQEMMSGTGMSTSRSGETEDGV